LGVVLERPELQREALAAHDVVGVHAGDERRPGPFEPRLERLHEPALGPTQKLDAWIARGEDAGDLGRAIGGAVVDDDAAPARLRLARHAAERRPERPLGIAGGQEDIDAWRAQSSRSASASTASACPG